MTDDRYRSPLGTRYASAAMQTLWGDRHRVGLWRRLWLALAESERELGLAVPDEAIAAMRAHLDDADLDVAAKYERRFRHDVMAHVHAFGDQAVAARPFIHLGATSAFVTDNADLVVMREGLRLGVDFASTVSCYQADEQGRACRHCDACRLRAAGFAEAGVTDPTRYQVE